MVVENVTEGIGEIIGGLGSVALWLQTVGVILIFWIVVQVISLIINRRRMQEIYRIKKDMVRIEKKIDRILQKK